MSRDDKLTMEIFIHNLTRAQVIAIEDLLATWQQGGSLGCSRWTAFFADGDGNFRPTCVVDGHVARHQQHVEQHNVWTGGDSWRGEYRMDYDRIAWALHREDQSMARSAFASGNQSESAQADPAVAGTGE